MSTTTPGSSRPDPTRPILVGTQVPAPPVPPAQPGPRRSGGLITGLIVAVVVLAVAVLGVGGWAVLRPYLGAPGQTGTLATTVPTTQPAQSPSTGPTTPVTPENPLTVVAYDLTPGVPAGFWSWIIGVWDGVAVFELGYEGNSPSILRGVDVATGAILWTMDSTPDGAAFRTGLDRSWWESGGMLAVQLDAPGWWTSPSDQCPGASTLVLITLRTGEVTASHSWQPTCGTDEGGNPVVRSQQFLAYADGIVVLLDATFPTVDAYDVASATRAYRVTDFTRPLWSAEGRQEIGGWGGTPVEGWWGTGGALILDRWVAAVTGEYVDLYTGEPTGMTFRTPHTEDNTGQDVVVAGDRLFTEAWVRMSDVPGSISLWSAPTDRTPVWTYSPSVTGMRLPSGSSNGTSAASPRSWVCWSGDVGIDMVRLRILVDDSYQITAVDLTTGRVLWSHEEDAADPVCGITSAGDQEMLAVATSRGVRFLDAVTGQEMAPALSWADASGGSAGIVTLDPCGESSVCATRVWDTGASTAMASMVVLTYADHTVAMEDTGVVAVAAPPFVDGTHRVWYSGGQEEGQFILG